MPHVPMRVVVLVLLTSAGGVRAEDQPVAIHAAGDLKPNVGKLVAIKGVWSDRGKIGPYVLLAGEGIYLSGTADQMNRLFGLWDKHPVHITGTLRFFEVPAAKRAQLAKEHPDMAAPPDYFHINIDDLRVYDSEHPELGFQIARHRPTRGTLAFNSYDRWKPVNAEPREVEAFDIGDCVPRRVPAELDPSGPHAGGFVNVYVNPAGCEAYRDAAGRLPRGTIIVKQKRLAKADRQSEELGVMIKRDAGFDRSADDWEFLFVDKSQRVIYDRKETWNCRSCHERAAHEYVFRHGLPNPK